jgi:very-short-patch-repair endonuclease
MENEILCEICKKEFSIINSQHLKNHNITISEYKKIFPNSKFVSANSKEKISISTAKLWQTPEYIKSHIEATIRSHNILEYKLKASKGQKLSYQNNPERKEKIRNKLLGHKVSDVTKEKIRQKKIGILSEKRGKSYDELYGYEKSLEIRQKQANQHKNKKFSEYHRRVMSETHKRKFLDENFRRSWAIRFHKKPGPLEQKLIEIINSNNLPFKYTGNLSTWVGSTIGVKNPDFMSSVGKKQVIELLGEYWHQKRPNIRFHQTAEGTKEHYQKAGFNCLIIWDYEIKKDPQQVLQKIKAFSESN